MASLFAGMGLGASGAAGGTAAGAGAAGAGAAGGTAGAAGTGAGAAGAGAGAAGAGTTFGGLTVNEYAALANKLLSQKQSGLMQTPFPSLMGQQGFLPSPTSRDPTPAPRLMTPPVQQRRKPRINIRSNSIGEGRR